MMRKRLGDLLIEGGMITREQLARALKVQAKMGKRLGRVLVELGFVSEQGLVEALEFQLGISHVDLSITAIEPDVAALIPEAVAKRHQIIPIR
ncbi:MAG TPA: type II secretion system protein GspE, partial [Firmicutes bacterium]|nr:type II secretion system protein GspE [Bacillota bacterium]